MSDLLNHDDTTARRVGFGENTPPETERIVTLVMDAAFKIHRLLGPGLLESVYEECMVHELTRMGLKLQRQIELPIHYDGLVLKAKLRIDLIVEDTIIVERKAVEQNNSLHQAQLLTYLTLTHKRIGLPINFNTEHLKTGFKRIIL